MISSLRIVFCIFSPLSAALIGTLVISCAPADAARVDALNPTSEIERAAGPSPSPIQVWLDGVHLAGCTSLYFDSGANEGLSGNIQTASPAEIVLQLFARQDA